MLKNDLPAIARQEKYFPFLTSTIQITLLPSKSGDQDVGTRSLISASEVLKRHQSGVDGDTVMEESGEGRLGRSRRQIELLGIDF